LAKLFTPGYAAETARREFLVNRMVYDMGVPTPEPIRLITDGTRYGAEYELIVGKRSFTRIISQEPGQLEPLSLLFARLSRELHATKADTARLPDMRSLVRDAVVRFESLPQNLKVLLLDALDALPSADTCLHGDLHIGNIITDGKRNLWIDVGDFAYGRPEWDLAMMYYAEKHISEERAQSIFHLGLDTLAKHWDVFSKAYWNTENPEELEAHVKGLGPYISLKLTYVLCKLHDRKGPVSEGLLKLIENYLR
jgi:uncharacterized protein (TIGR02172 family)